MLETSNSKVQFTITTKLQNKMILERGILHTLLYIEESRSCFLFTCQRLGFILVHMAKLRKGFPERIVKKETNRTKGKDICVCDIK